MATTESASGVSSSQETLNGTLNPERSQAHYHFEYGKTTSYGSSTGEQSAGSGTSDEKESATISGLEEGTTYHYRLVVKNAVGTTYGGDQAFTTLSKPGASTTSASAVMEEEATLNGTVNPKGSSTKYYFQYGETTSYGKTTPEGSAGSGTSGVAENATVSELQPGLTYHYRIVGISLAGTTYGSDQTLETLSAPVSLLRPSGEQDIFYRGTNGQLHWEWWNGSKWALQYKSGAPAMVGNPSVVETSQGYLEVFYRDINGRLDYWWWNGKEWTEQYLGESGAMGGKPTHLLKTNGEQEILFAQSNGRLDYWLWNNEKWALQWLGEAGAL